MPTASRTHTQTPSSWPHSRHRCSSASTASPILTISAPSAGAQRVQVRPVSSCQRTARPGLPPPSAGHRPVRSSTFHSLSCRDRKSTRLNSSHITISYAVFCLKKKKKKHHTYLIKKKKKKKKKKH